MKEHLVKIFQAASLNFTGSIIKVAIGFLSLPIITRLLSQELYGVFILGTTITFIANRIISLGIPGALSYFIPKYRVEHNTASVRALLRISVRIHLILGIIAYAVVFFFADFFGLLFDEPRLGEVLRVIAISIPFLILIDDTGNIFTGIKNATVPILLNSFFQPFFRIVFIAALLLSGYELFGISLAHTISYVCTGILFLLLFYKKARPELLDQVSSQPSTQKNAFSLKTFFLYAIPLSLSEIIFLVLSYTDVILTGKFLSAADVAVYSIVYNLSKILNLLPVAMLILYKPISAQLFAEGKMLEVKSILQYISRWIVIINFPLLAGFLVLPKEILTLVFDATYESGYIALQLLTIGFFISTLFGPITQLFEASGRTNITFVNAAVTAAVTILLNLVLIPRFGVTGAAIATCGSLIFMVLLSLVQIFFSFRIHPFSWKLGYLTLVGAATALAYWLVSRILVLDSLFSAVLSGVLFCVVYAGVLVLTKAVNAEDRKFLWAILKRKTQKSIQ